MFTTPDLSPAGKLVFAYATYTAMLMAYTVANVPYSALMGVMTADGEERTKLSSFRFVGAFSAGLVVQYCTLPLAFFFGGGHAALENASARLDPVVAEVAAFAATSQSPVDAALKTQLDAWTALPPAADAKNFSAHLASAQALEQALGRLSAPDAPASSEGPVHIASILPADLLDKVSDATGQTLAQLRRARADGFQWAMTVFAVVGTAFWIVAFYASRERIAPPPGAKTSLRADLASLRRNAPWQIISLITFFVLTAVVIRGGATIYFFKYTLDAPHFTRWFGKRRSLIWIFGATALTAGLTFWVQPGQWVALYALSLVSAFAGGMQSVMNWAIFADTADYGEHRTGVRNTGLIFASALFALKTGITVGGAVLGWYLAAINFVPDTVPTDGTALGIRMLYTLVPAAIMLLCFALMFIYPLHERDLRRINEELTARRANPAS